MAAALHLNLDDAWAVGPELTTLDAREWGPQLRFSAPPHVVEEFYGAYADRLAPFLLYGSGDFHHLTALWVRRFAEPLTLISFDNHPDWDVRPPKWCCGGWVNRALELPHVRKVCVWGCGNFECWWPGQLFGNRRAERAGKLEVRAWADDRPIAQQQRRGAIFSKSWRVDFEGFVARIARENVYVTIDLDCLKPEEAVTNWENGRFEVADLTWALGLLRHATNVAGGDVCGAFSIPKYARWKQRFVSEFDHPRLNRPDEETARAINAATLETLWPALAQ